MTRRQAALDLHVISERDACGGNQVAVGESSKGSPGVRVPPVNLNAGPGQRFDSFSDDPNNPTIFVVQVTAREGSEASVQSDRELK